MKKGLKIFGGVLVVLLMLLFAFPIIFKHQISERVKEEINSQINGRVDYSDLSFSLFRHFPNPSISLEHFVLTGGPGFENDTVASIRNFGFSVDLYSVLRGHDYRVLSFNVVRPCINLRVNNSGHANWDIMKYALSFSHGTSGNTAATEKQADFSLQLDNWKIENARLTYANDITHTFFALSDSIDAGNLTATKSGYEYESDMGQGELTYRAGGIYYFNKAALNNHLHFSIDELTGLYTFNENQISLNDLSLNLEGTIKSTTEGPDFNLRVSTKDTAVKNLLSVIPVSNNTGGDGLNAQGSFSFMGAVNGLYHANQYPAIACNLKVANASFNNSGRVLNINLTASAEKPEGPLDSITIRSLMQVKTGSNDTARIELLVTTPAGDANLRAQIDGSFDESIIPDVYNGDEGSGLVVHLKLGGLKSDYDKKNYDRIETSGYATLAACIYKPQGSPYGVELGEAIFSFHPDWISLVRFKASLGKNVINGNGTIEHLSSYFSGKGNAIVTLNSYADHFSMADLQTDYRPFIPKAQSKSGVTDADKDKNLSAGSVKKDTSRYIDILINTTVKNVACQKVVLQNFKAQVELIANKIFVRNASADLFGGKMTISAGCGDVYAPNPPIYFDFGLNNMSIQQVYKSMEQGGMVVPSLKCMSGNFSGELRAGGKLNTDKTLDYKNLRSVGKLIIPDLHIDELPVLMDIAKLAKVKSFEHLEAKNTECNFKFENGIATIYTTDVKFTSGTKITFKGTSDAAQNVDADIDLSVPMREFGQVASLAQNILGGFMKVPENMQFKFKVTGKANNPAVNLMGMGTN